MKRTILWGSVAALGSLAALAAACGGGDAAAGKGGAAAPNGAEGVRPNVITHEPCEGARVEALDANNDGKPEVRRVLGEGGRELCRSADLNRDGKPDLFQYYDAQGQIRRREADYNDDGVMNLIEYYEGGKLARRELDTLSQGKIDTWDTFDTATGKITKRERDATGDGRIDQWWVYEGDKITIAMDRNGDGLPDPDATVVMGENGKPAPAVAAGTDAGVPLPDAAAQVSPAPAPSGPLHDAGAHPDGAAPHRATGAKR